MIYAGFNQVQPIVRTFWRLMWFSVEIIRGLLTYRRTTLDARNVQARWLHRMCRRVLRIFGVHSSVIGSVPTCGLLVANHLSYLDIILLASFTPCVFVAKSDVKGWPLLGWFARMAGTVFVNRRSRYDAVRANEMIRPALRDGALVVLFPEGTSSDGATVLPFRSSLLETAIDECTPITAAALHYKLAGGDAGTEVCYWGNHTLVPHLLNLFSKRSVRAHVAFSEVANACHDRKELARQLHDEVSRLQSELRYSSAGVAKTVLSEYLKDN
jgi:lyso-ornithine lipid O-acyltransferase